MLCFEHQGKQLIQTCLNSPDPPESNVNHNFDQRMSAQGFEEPDLTYAPPEETKVCNLFMTFAFFPLPGFCFLCIVFIHDVMLSIIC